MVVSAKARKLVLTEFRRNEIISAALHVFGVKGFAAARAEDIAARAGIAKGTLYLYFGSKEDIYVAAVQHAFEQLNGRIRESLQSVEGVQQRLGMLVTARLEFWLEKKSLYRLLLTVGREPQHRKQTNAALRATAQSLIELFEEGVAAGELQARAFDAIAWAAVDMIRGANERRLDGIATHPVEEDARFITEVTLRTLGFARVDSMESFIP